MPPELSVNGSSAAKVKSDSNVGSRATRVLMLNLSLSIQFPRTEAVQNSSFSLLHFQSAN
jgi:hypothetical protein